MEEMNRRAHKMEELMDYDTLSLFPNVRLPPKFKMPTLDKFDGTGCPKSHLKMYMRAMQPLGTTEEVLGSLTWMMQEQEVGKTSVESFTSNISTI